MNTAAALSGVRILDFTRAMAGPYGSMVLGDFGADVIKVEAPLRQDGLISDRASGISSVAGESPMFMTYNRNKRSICIDMRHAEAPAVLARLIPQVDVLVQNFRPGVADRMGIGWEKARALNPRLIYVTITGFGARGPWSDRPAIDIVVQAMSGIMSVTGEKGGDPLLCGVPVADFTGAMVSVQAVLLALLARHSTGQGQYVEVPMLAASFMSLGHKLGPYFTSGKDPGRVGNEHEQYAPFRSFKTAAGGHVVGGVVRERQWRPFCEILGALHLVDDPRFKSNADRVAHREDLDELLDPLFLKKPATEWERLFTAASIPFGAVNTFSEALGSEQARVNGMIVHVDHPLAGRFPMVAPAIRLSATPGTVRSPAPLLGEHSRPVLAELGFKGDEIESLLRRGVVEQAHLGAPHD